MQGVSLRRRACVLCGEPIVERGRIDRLYCSSSCRTLAWKARKQRAAGGGMAPASPAAAVAFPEYAPVGALVQLAQRLESDREAAQRELTVARARIAELEERPHALSAQAARLPALEAQLRAHEQAALHTSTQTAALQHDLTATRRERDQLAAQLATAQQRARAAPALALLQSSQESERSARARITELEHALRTAQAERDELSLRLSQVQLAASEAREQAQRASAPLQVQSDALRRAKEDAERAQAERQAAQAQHESALHQMEERARRAEATQSEHDKRATEASQKINDLQTKLATAQVARQLAEEREQQALRQREEAEARLRTEAAAHRTARDQAQKLEGTLAAASTSAEPPAARRLDEGPLPAERIVAQILTAYEAVLQRKDPAQAAEVQAFLRANGELLHKVGATLVHLIRQMRADGETDPRALAHRALDRTRQAMLRSVDESARGTVRRALDQRRVLLAHLAQVLAARTADEAAGAPAAEAVRSPWSERADRALTRLSEELRRLGGHAPETTGWIETHQPLLQQLGEALLERAQRGAERGPTPTAGRLMTEAVEEVAWRHFDTEAEAARWAQQNHVVLAKLVVLLTRA